MNVKIVQTNFRTFTLMRKLYGRVDVKGDSNTYLYHNLFSSFPHEKCEDMTRNKK